MSKDYITTPELIDELTAAGFRAHIQNEAHGTFVNVYDDSWGAGSVQVDKAYSMKVTTNTAPDYRKYLLDTLYRYASTPLDKRDEPLYKIGIKDTTLYLLHINDKEITATVNERAAKAYRRGNADEIIDSLKERGVTAFAKEVKNVTN
jgi:hypothetical protein|nr:MAG TPA: hypothetical protein [Caudoviricetes sp.]